MKPVFCCPGCQPGVPEFVFLIVAGAGILPSEGSVPKTVLRFIAPSQVLNDHLSVRVLSMCSCI